MIYRITQLLLFLGFALSLNAQTYNVTVGGTVTDANGGLIPGAYLMVSIVPNNPLGFSYSNLVQTDSSGNYSDQIEVPNTTQQGSVIVAIIDCDSNSVTQTAYFGAGSNNVFDLDFTFCGDPAGGSCNAWISVQYTSAGAVLTVQAIGDAPFTYFWSNASGTSNPTLTVTQSGTYCVVVADSSGCSTSACITVQMPGGNNCSVQTQVDSTNVGSLVVAAYPTGTAPFTYLWNNGAATQTIPFQAAGVNICVTVTDATGCVATDCLFGPPPGCNVTITVNPNTVGLWASPTGTAPFTFLWNTGQTTQNLIPPALFGVYCVTVTDANGCTASACYQWGGGVGCGVAIISDSIPSTPAGTWLHAEAWGIAPFTYQWSVQNANTQNILVGNTGTYCLTVTDASGCTASDCVTLGSNNCVVNIIEGNASLFAVVSSVAGWTFQWSNGQTGQSIVPTTSGNYCVTATNSAANCVATACFQYLSPNIYGLSGFVLQPDSNLAVLLQGKAELFQLDPATAVPTLVDSVELEGSAPGTIGSFYDFGQVAAGVYVVKISLDPASPYFDEYLPTYYGNVLLWQNALEITVPHGGGYFNVVLVDGNPFGSGNGDGVISGTVTDGDGFTANGSGNRGGGDPLPNVSILLFDEQEQPLSHTLTDADGKYQFENLPFGTYKVGVEITGMEQAWRWVTLTHENPAAENQDFSVSESGVSDAGETVKMALPTLSAQPNPVRDVLTINVQSPANFEARLSLSSATGGEVFGQMKPIAKGNQTLQIQVGDLPAGLYFLNLTGGSGVVSTRIMKK
ncbi:MAG: carboxypeptidase regulatory-like domain-containing protein [Bacteroidota bacterium]